MKYESRSQCISLWGRPLSLSVLLTYGSFESCEEYYHGIHGIHGKKGAASFHGRGRNQDAFQRFKVFRNAIELRGLASTSVSSNMVVPQRSPPATAPKFRRSSLVAAERGEAGLGSIGNR